MIRRRAELGDLNFGFAANSLYKDNRFIYVACVTGKLSDGTYLSMRNAAIAYTNSKPVATIGRVAHCIIALKILRMILACILTIQMPTCF
jgi:hypothetical protein